MMNFFRTVKSALIFIFVLTFGLMGATLAFQDATPTPAPAHWTYEGEEGPEFWGELDANYAACSSGHAQSPIDLIGVQGVDLTAIVFNYNPSALNIFNNGHTIQVNYDAGSSITYNETEYSLIQFHFHHPSEHTVNGESFPMELHLVHADAKGNLAVVGILLRQGEADNAGLADVFANLPPEKSDPQPTELSVNAGDLLPQSRLYDTYTGSLTTPPCTQGVRWLVLTEPVEVSEAQLESFAAIFEMNARPVQPLNNRDLLADDSGE
jgi:carbonic anhydrase